MWEWYRRYIRYRSTMRLSDADTLVLRTIEDLGLLRERMVELEEYFALARNDLARLLAQCAAAHMHGVDQRQSLPPANEPPVLGTVTLGGGQRQRETPHIIQ